ncbi:MAG: hypothetical protein M1839_005367 [Geoglossum umbratile]|nr:MAG: hypothetical protein M1839_005367 [Geoglossum umbratile]
MPVQSDAISVTGKIYFRQIVSENQKLFHINSAENKLSLGFEIRQEEGFVTAVVRVLGGLKPGSSIHILKTECELYLLDDDKPDLSPSAHTGLYLSNRPVQLCFLDLRGFRGERSYVAKLTYMWSESTIVFQQLAPLFCSSLSNQKSIYAIECSEDNIVHEREDKKLEITEEVDFSNARIGIRRVLALTMPGKEPYYFVINIVRDREEYSRGRVQLRAATSERRGTRLGKLAVDMSIGGVVSTRAYCVPETEYEGVVFSLAAQINMPKYGLHLVSCVLKMEFPIEATFTELNVGETDKMQTLGGAAEWQLID